MIFLTGTDSGELLGVNKRSFGWNCDVLELWNYRFRFAMDRWSLGTEMQVFRSHWGHTSSQLHVPNVLQGNVALCLLESRQILVRSYWLVFLIRFGLPDLGRCSGWLFGSGIIFLRVLALWNEPIDPIVKIDFPISISIQSFENSFCSRIGHLTGVDFEEVINVSNVHEAFADGVEFFEQVVQIVLIGF